MSTELTVWRVEVVTGDGRAGPYAGQGCNLGGFHLGQTLTATCHTDPQHAPPTPGCGCGLYAMTNPADAVELAQRVSRNIRQEGQPFLAALARGQMLAATSEIPAGDSAGKPFGEPDPPSTVRGATFTTEHYYIEEWGNAATLDLRPLTGLPVHVPVTLTPDLGTLLGRPNTAGPNRAERRAAARAGRRGR